LARRNYPQHGLHLHLLKEKANNSFKACRKFELDENKMTGLIIVLSMGEIKYAKPKINLHLSCIKSEGKMILSIKYIPKRNQQTKFATTIDLNIFITF